MKVLYCNFITNDLITKINTVWRHRELCTPFNYEMLHRLTFRTRKKTKRSGEILSVEICKPFDEGFGKSHYLVVYKDSYAKFRYEHFIKAKSNIKDNLIEIIAYFKTTIDQFSFYIINNLWCDSCIFYKYSKIFLIRSWKKLVKTSKRNFYLLQIFCKYSFAILVKNKRNS